MVKIYYESKLAKAILWSGYPTITLFGMVFTKRKESQMSDDDKRHETLHAIQQRDCLWLGLIVSVVLFGILMLCGIQSWWFILYVALLTPLWYYVMYVTEWIFGLIWNLFHGWGDKTQNVVIIQYHLNRNHTKWKIILATLKIVNFVHGSNTTSVLKFINVSYN